MERLKCDGCGANSFVKIGDKMICEYCGTEYTADSNNAPQNQWQSFKQSFDNVKSNNDTNGAIIDFIITICLGGLGVHKFMKGKIGLGILYLLTGGIFGIGYLIDVIVSGVKLFNIATKK